MIARLDLILTDRQPGTAMDTTEGVNLTKHRRTGSWADAAISPETNRELLADLHRKQAEKRLTENDKENPITKSQVGSMSNTLKPR